MSRRHVIVAVCLGLALLCAGLLLTLVAKVREAQARMVCTSHFKQLALALHNYGDSYHSRGPGRGGAAFPAGTVPHPTLPPDQRLGWWVLILPYFEEEKVFKQFDLTRGPGDPVNLAPANNRFQMLVCPASGEGKYDNDTRTRSWKSPTPLTHYVGVAGVGADAAELPLKHPRAGVFGHDRRTAIADITDGTSYTLLLIETADSPGHWAFGGTATVRAFDPPAAPYTGAGRPFGGWHGGDSWSGRFAAQVYTVAFADTSVRSLSTKIAPEVLEALATVAGKEELPPNW